MVFGTKRCLLIILGYVFTCAGTAFAEINTDDSLVLENMTEPGLRLQVYEIGEGMERLWPILPDQTPNYETIVSAADLNGDKSFGGRESYYRARLSATLRVERAGDYLFRLRADDGAYLTINGQRVVSQTSPFMQHVTQEGQLNLTPGKYRLVVEHFQNLTDAQLKLWWKRPGDEAYAVLGGEAVGVDASIIPVVSPGLKWLDRPGMPRPGDGRALEAVHPSYRVVNLRPEGAEPQVGALLYRENGDLVVVEMAPPSGVSEKPGSPSPTPNSSVWIYDNADEVTSNDQTARITRRLIADGLYDCAGIAEIEGRLLITTRDGVARLVDQDGDGFFETHESVVRGVWETDNFHQLTFGLIAKEGRLYTSLSTSIMNTPMANAFGVVEPEKIVGLNGPNPPHRGSLAEIDPVLGSVTFIAGGLRTPNGLTVGPDGELFGTDNQGAWLPANKINHLQPGRFYGHYLPDLAYKNEPHGGHPSPFQDQPPTPPAVWLPQTELANSPTQPLFIEDGPYAGQMLVGELTLGGIRRVFLEKVNGVYQGAAFRFTQGLEGGVNRLCWGPEGSLYVGMIGRGPGGNWNWRGTTFGLQKLVPTGQTTFEIQSLSIKPDGFVIRFTQPVALDWLTEASHYEVSTFTYKPTAAYGGPKVDEHPLEVIAATPSDDGQEVALQIAGLRPGYVVAFRLDPKSTDGQVIWSTQAWYTINEIPQ